MRSVAVLLAALAACQPAPAAGAPRIKDIVSVESVRVNQLVGYGLVVGLAGTGDRLRNAPFTRESLQSMLERMGVSVRGTDLRIQNVAAVTVTATLPPFARTGSTIDVQVSAMGDATSLQGGTLLIAPLRGLDGQVYAMAQGSVAVSGFKAQGQAARINRGVLASARMAGGAIVEKEVPFVLRSAGSLKLALRNPDFTTAQRVRPEWRGSLASDERGALAASLEQLQQAAIANAGVLARHIDLSRELLDAISAEARRLSGTRTETYGASGGLRHLDLAAPISINTNL